jgi:hypothetical protein
MEKIKATWHAPDIPTTCRKLKIGGSVSRLTWAKIKTLSPK